MRKIFDKYVVCQYLKKDPNHATWLYSVETFEEALKIVYKIIKEDVNIERNTSKYDHIEIGKYIDKYSVRNEVVADFVR